MKLIIIGMYLFHILVDYIMAKLNDHQLQLELPDNVKDLYSPYKYQRYLNYKKEHRKVKRLETLIMCILTFIYFGLNIHYQLWQLLPWNIYISSYVLFLIFSLISTPISIALDYYRTFVIEAKYGFNKATKKTFFVDQIKDIFLSLVLMLVIVILLIYFHTHFGNIGMIILFMITLVFVLVINLFSLQILKIFNKFTPLEDGELKTKIIELCENNGLTVRSINVMDASTRTSRANAFCTGLTKQKDISLDDNLIKLMSEEEILAVFSHEIGHATYNHIYRTLAITFFQFIIYFIVIAYLLNSNIYESFGFTSINYILMIDILPIILYPISFIYQIITNTVSRKCEYEADLFAHNLGYGPQLVSSLKKLCANDLMNLNPHPLVVKCEYSHPTLSQRIKVLEKGEL